MIKTCMNDCYDIYNIFSIIMIDQAKYLYNAFYSNKCNNSYYILNLVLFLLIYLKFKKNKIEFDKFKDKNKIEFDELKLQIDDKISNLTNNYKIELDDKINRMKDDNKIEFNNFSDFIKLELTIFKLQINELESKYNKLKIQINENELKYNENELKYNKEIKQLESELMIDYNNLCEFKDNTNKRLDRFNEINKYQNVINEAIIYETKYKEKHHISTLCDKYKLFIIIDIDEVKNLSICDKCKNDINKTFVENQSTLCEIYNILYRCPNSCKLNAPFHIDYLIEKIKNNIISN